MKRRATLVSNSSSCSFVLVGFEVPEGKYEYEEIEEIARKVTKKSVNIYNSEDDGAPDGTYLVGFARSFDDDDGTTSWDVANALELAQQLATEFDVPRSKVKAYCGTCMC